MRVVSVQVGRVQTLARPGGPERTAIDKRPTGGPVRATAIGLEGDETCEIRGVDEQDQSGQLLYAFCKVCIF